MHGGLHSAAHLLQLPLCIGGRYSMRYLWSWQGTLGPVLEPSAQSNTHKRDDNYHYSSSGNYYQYPTVPISCCNNRGVKHWWSSVARTRICYWTPWFSPIAQTMNWGGRGSLWRPLTNTLFWSWESLRSEEHTSELQSHVRISYAVFCLKKKKYNLNLLSPNMY